MTTPTLPDLLPALRTWLLTSSVAASVTGGDVASADAATVRVYAGRLPFPPIMAASRANAPAPALVVAGAGGAANPWLPFLASVRVELRAYSGDEASASALWYAAVNALLAAAVPGTTLWFEAQAPSLPRVGPEPLTNFVVCAGMVPVTIIGH